MKNKYQVLAELIRQQLESVTWTHKIQEKQADIYSKRYSRVETIGIIFTSLTSCGIVALCFGEDGIVYKIFTAFSSFVSLATLVYCKSFNLVSMSNEHKKAANRLVAIRNELRSLVVYCEIHEMSVADIKKEFDSISRRLNILYQEIPSATDKAVRQAKIALNEDFEIKNLEVASVGKKSRKMWKKL